MKKLINFIKQYKYPRKYYNNPNIEDWMKLNNINEITEDIQYFFEYMMWNTWRGAKYEIFK